MSDVKHTQLVMSIVGTYNDGQSAAEVHHKTGLYAGPMPAARAAFIVEAVNNYASLRERCERLTTALELCLPLAESYVMQAGFRDGGNARSLDKARLALDDSKASETADEGEGK